VSACACACVPACVTAYVFRAYGLLGRKGCIGGCIQVLVGRRGCSLSSPLYRASGLGSMSIILLTAYCARVSILLAAYPPPLITSLY